MTRQELPGTDLIVSDFCYGTLNFGGGIDGVDMDKLLGIFRDAGGNFLDTAHCYSFWLPGGTGCSERALGDYLRRNGKGDLIIGTKGGHPTIEGYRTEDHWLGQACIEADIDESLERLGLDTIDVYWLHRDDPRVPAGEVIDTLNREVTRGRIRWLGASNWHPLRIEEANAYATEHGLRGFSASQPQFSLAHRNIPNPPYPGDDTDPCAMVFLDDEHQQWHARVKMPVIPFSPTAGGYFASNGERRKEAYDNPISRERLRRAQALAEEVDATSGQVALAWLMHQPYPVFPILGSCDPQHLQDGLDAASLNLSREQIDGLTDSPTQEDT